MQEKNKVGGEKRERVRFTDYFFNFLSILHNLFFSKKKIAKISYGVIFQKTKGTLVLKQLNITSFP